jgi:hypothetical protein
VTLPRKKKADRIWILNLNSYRNTHFQILNQAKIAWKSVVDNALRSVGYKCIYDPPYRFTYTVFPATMRKFDVGNVCSIIDKFTADALQGCGFIADDNYKNIPEVVYRFGGIEKLNPRCELTIERLKGE